MDQENVSEMGERAVKPGSPQRSPLLLPWDDFLDPPGHIRSKKKRGKYANDSGKLQS